MSRRIPIKPRPKPVKLPESTRSRVAEAEARSAAIAANARARMDALGVTPIALSRALGLTRSAIAARLREPRMGPGAVRYLSVLLLCSEDALTASTPDAVRLAWRPGVALDQWLPTVASIIREGRPLPTFEAARTRVQEAMFAGGKPAARPREVGFIASDA